jgi:hypothetical protein
MKGHSWNRREFSVTPNGYFTVLRPTGWFSSVRLPGGYRYQVDLSERNEYPLAHENPTENPATAFPPESTISEQKALDHADSQQTAILSQSIIPSTQDHRLMRTALIVLAAIVISYLILWWAPFALWVGSSQP